MQCLTIESILDMMKGNSRGLIVINAFETMERVSTEMVGCGLQW